MHRAAGLNYWHTAQTPIHTPQDMQQEVSSQSKSRTDYGRHTVLHRAMTTIPHQVTETSNKIRFKKLIKKTPYGTAGTLKQHKHWHTHTHDNIRTIHTHGFSTVDMW